MTQKGWTRDIIEPAELRSPEEMERDGFLRYHIYYGVGDEKRLLSSVWVKEVDNGY
jgi:hypothetical protein